MEGGEGVGCGMDESKGSMKRVKGRGGVRRRVEEGGDGRKRKG